jgi:hypothetical protein
MHSVKLENLTPGKKYVYICGNADHGWSAVSSFVVPEADQEDPYFAIVGSLYSNTQSTDKALQVLYS